MGIEPGPPDPKSGNLRGYKPAHTANYTNVDRDIYTFENTIDPDHLAFGEAS